MAKQPEHRRLSPAEIKRRYDWLVNAGHPKIVRDKKTLDYFMKMENRHELTSAYLSAQKAQHKYQTTPEDLGYLAQTPEHEAVFQKKLNSEFITEKTRNRYIAAFNAVRDGGGRQAPRSLIEELSRARMSVTTTYSTKVRAVAIKEAKDIAEIDPDLLTEKQRKLLDDHIAREERRLISDRNKREARGLRSKIASLETQKRLLSENVDTFVKRLVRDGYEDWLEANPNKVKSLADGTKLTPSQQSENYWRLLSDSEKQAWYEVAAPIQSHNNEIIKKYDAIGEVVPRDVQINELKQLHHMLPKRGRDNPNVRGGHFPAQTSAVLGDAYQARGSQHGLLHDPKLDRIYNIFEDQDYMPFDLNDPNIISRESGVPEPNKRGLSYLSKLAKSLMNFKGLPFGIGLLATTGASMLPSQSAEASTVRGRMRENLTNPNWLWSMATMLPEDFWSGVAESKERFSGSSYKEDFARAAEQRRQLREGILNIPERARNLYGQVRSIFD